MLMLWHPETHEPILAEREEYVELANEGWLTEQPYHITKEIENDNQESNYIEAERNQKSYEKNSKDDFTQGTYGDENEPRDKRCLPNDRKRKAK